MDKAIIKKYNDALKGAEISGVGKVGGISEHAVERALERYITVEAIKNVLKNYNISFPGTSLRGTTRYVLDDISVIVGADNMIIATVFRRD